MKKIKKSARSAISMLLACTLCIAACILPVAAVDVGAHPAASVSGHVPIYLENILTNYMADDILSQMDLSSNDSRTLIRTVYNWIIRNCERSDTLGFVDENGMITDSKPAYDMNALKQTVQPLISVYQNLADSGRIEVVSDLVIDKWAQEMMLYRSGTCVHFAAMLQVLLQALGYPCQFVSGEFINNDGSRAEHSWNAVQIDGRWYWLDIRMDHEIYERTGSIDYTYFLIDDSSTWKKSHSWDTAQYPDLVSQNPPQQSTVPTAPTTPSNAITVNRSSHKVILDGTPITLSAYNIGGVNYFKLRDVAQALLGTSGTFEVEWKQETNSIYVNIFGEYTPVGGELAPLPATATATPTQAKIYMNCLSLEYQNLVFDCYNINGNNYFPIRDLGAAIGVDVTWDNEAGAICLDTTKLLDTPVIDELLSSGMNIMGYPGYIEKQPIVLDMANQWRSEEGLQPISEDAILRDLAQRFCYWNAKGDNASLEAASELLSELCLASGVTNARTVYADFDIIPKEDVDENNFDYSLFRALSQRMPDYHFLQADIMRMGVGMKEDAEGNYYVAYLMVR